MSRLCFALAISFPEGSFRPDIKRRFIRGVPRWTVRREFVENLMDIPSDYQSVLRIIICYLIVILIWNDLTSIILIINCIVFDLCYIILFSENRNTSLRKNSSFIYYSENSFIFETRIKIS
jgi:hypothetical protein